MTPTTEREIDLLAAKIVRDWARVAAMSEAKEAARWKRMKKVERGSS